MGEPLATPVTVISVGGVRQGVTVAHPARDLRSCVYWGPYRDGGEPGLAAVRSLARGRRTDPASARVRFGIDAAVCAGFALLVALSPGLRATSWLGRTGAVGYGAVLVAVYLAGCGGGRVRRRAVVLALLAAVGYLPALHLGAHWTVLAGFFAGSILLTVRPVLAVPVSVVVCASAGALVWRFGTPSAAPFEALSATVFTAVLALALFGLSRCHRLVAEREHDQRELTRRAISEERLRFARDLHDVLGLSLSAITLKGELTNRLITDEPRRAKEELVELLAMSRRALADVRSVAAGYRELSLDEEWRAVAAVLRVAGVEAVVDRPPIALPDQVATTFAAVLREGVTNVVRHSKASRCELSVRADAEVAWLTVTNDGVDGTDAAGAAAAHGNGLPNLSFRVGMLGGELSAGIQPDGTHRLFVKIPLAPRGDRDGRPAGVPDPH